MSVESILRKKGTDVATIAPEVSVKRAADWLRAKNIGALVVTRDNEILGLISEREIVLAISRYGETATSMSVSEIMRHGVITVSPAETVSHVMNLMTRHRVRHMPVVHDGKLAGIISIGDVNAGLSAEPSNAEPSRPAPNRYAAASLLREADDLLLAACWLRNLGLIKTPWSRGDTTPAWPVSCPAVVPGSTQD